MRDKDKPLIDSKLEKVGSSPDFVAHKLIIELNEDIWSRIQDLGLRNKDLADRLGVSKSYVTRLLDGQPNLTLRSLAAIALALESEVTVSIRPKVPVMRAGSHRLRFEAEGEKRERSTGTSISKAAVEAVAASAAAA